MTTSIRTAWLLGLLGVFGAATAVAGPPDPTRACVPDFILVSGKVDGGVRPDPAAQFTIAIRDAVNEPIAGALVTIDFSGCCDINLCAEGVGHDCAARKVTGTTNVMGQVTFHVLGGARDPGNLVPPDQYGGCGYGGVHVYMNDGTGNVELFARGPTCSGTPERPPTAAVLDLNGAGGGSMGVSGSDVSNLINLFGSLSLGAPYRGRGDINMDGAISGADVSAEISHFGRLSISGGVGCADDVGTSVPYCAKPACP